MIPLILSCDCLALLCFCIITSNKYWTVWFLGFFLLFVCLGFGHLGGFHCKSALFCSGACFLEQTVIIAPFLELSHP